MFVLPAPLRRGGSVKWLVIAVVAVVALVIAVKLLRASKLIGLDDARRLLKLGGVLLDVRTREEFTSDHIPQARNIPLEQLQRRQHEVGRGHVVVYCGSGTESAKASKMLRGAGLTKVHDFGAMSRWKAAA